MVLRCARVRGVFSKSPISTDTRIIRTPWHVRSVSVLKGFHCTNKLLTDKTLKKVRQSQEFCSSFFSTRKRFIPNWESLHPKGDFKHWNKTVSVRSWEKKSWTILSNNQVVRLHFGFIKWQFTEQNKALFFPKHRVTWTVTASSRQGTSLFSGCCVAVV